MLLHKMGDLYQLLSLLQPGDGLVFPQTDTPSGAIYFNDPHRVGCDLLNFEVGSVAPMTLPPPKR